MPTWTVGVVPAAAAGTCAALAFGGYGALGLRAPLAPAFAQEPGGTIAMVLRVGLLFAVGIMPADAAGAKGRPRTWSLAVIGALFLLSLAARGALCLLVLGALGDLVWLSRRATVTPAPRIPWFIPAACLVWLGLASAKPEAAAPPRSDERSRASFWRARGNLWRARGCALAWASAERPPGEAYVALAEANWDLGRRETARRVLAKVLAGEPPDAIRRHAEAVLQLWNR